MWVQFISMVCADNHRLMSQDENYLRVLRLSGTLKQKEQAQKVLNLLQRGKHWVLVTLLLGNTMTNETLAILLDRDMTGGWPAVLASTALVVIFGEIIPQSVCAKHGLSIGARCSTFVLCLMYLLSPVAYPTARLLDRLVSTHQGVVFEKASLKTLVGFHHSVLRPDEMNIISSTLELNEKPVSAIMTPLSEVFSLSSNDVLSSAMKEKIWNCGYSRIPMHPAGDSVSWMGFLEVKSLALLDSGSGVTFDQLAISPLPAVAKETRCLDMLHLFQQKGTHMAQVTEKGGRAVGILTLGDMMKELVGGSSFITMSVDDGSPRSSSENSPLQIPEFPQSKRLLSFASTASS